MTDLAQTLIQEEEGPAASHVYYVDGLAHIARGTLVDPSVPCDGLCQAAIAAQDDYELDAAKQRAGALAGYSACNAVRQAVLISMTYQLGSLVDWPLFRAAIAAGDYEEAATQMLASRWAHQTPARARREAEMMQSGAWVAQGATDE